jgi:hypothetical protein
LAPLPVRIGAYLALRAAMAATDAALFAAAVGALVFLLSIAA